MKLMLSSLKSLFHILWFAVYYLTRSKCASPCISSDLNKKLCYGCGNNYYQENMAAGFPEVNCRLKSKKFCDPKSVVIRSSTACEQCPLFFNKTYENLGDGLREESILAADCYSIELKIFLLGQKHILVSNFYEKEFHLFRRVKVELAIKPVLCDEIDITGCINKGEKVEIVLKDSNLIFFIAQSFSIQSIIFDGKDLNFKGQNLTCYKSSEYCCKEIDEIIEKYWNKSDCGIRGFDQDSIYHSTSRGLINIEPLLEESTLPIITVSDCTFQNFFLLRTELSFKSLFKINTILPSYFNISKVQITYFLSFDGVIGTDDLSTLVKIDPFFKYCQLDLNFTVNSAASLITNFSSQFYFEGSAIKFIFSSYELGFTTSLIAYKSLFNLNMPVFSLVIFKNILFENISAFGPFLPSRPNSLIINSLLSITTLSNATKIFLECINITRTEYISLFKIVSLAMLTIREIRISQSVGFNSSLVWLECANLDLSNLLAADCNSVFNPSFLLLLKCTASMPSLVDNIEITRCSDFLFGTTVGALIMNNSIFVNISFSQPLFQFNESFFQLVNSKMMNVIANGFSKSFFLLAYHSNISIYCVSVENVYSNYMLDLREINFCLLNEFFLKNLKCDAIFITAESSFQYFLFNSSSIIDSSINRLCFSMDASLFYNYRPSFSIVNSKLHDIEILHPYFAGFGRFDLLFKGSEFINLTCSKDGAQVRIWLIGSQSLLQITDSYFLRNGFTYMPKVTQFFYNYIVFLGSYLLSAVVKSTRFLNDEKVNLISGFISLAFVSNSLEITDCLFEAFNKNPAYSYHGAALSGANFLKFSNNQVKSLNCPPRNFLTQYHMNGVISLQGSESLRFINSKKVAFVENNTFLGCRCYQAGALSVSNFITTIANNTFIGNVAEQGGSMAVLSTSSAILKNNVFKNSRANLGGALVITDISKIDVSDTIFFEFMADSTGGVWIDNIEYIIFTNILQANGRSITDSGFFTVLRSNFVLFNGTFSNVSTESNGGIFLIDQQSSATIISIKADNCKADYGGVAAIMFADSFSISDSSFGNAATQKNGAVFYFDSLMSVKLRGLLVYNSSALFAGIIFIKTTENGAYFDFEHIDFYSNKAQSGSCIYFNSPSRISIKAFNISGSSGLLLKFTWSVKIFVFMSDISILNNTSNENLALFEEADIQLSNILLKWNRVRKNLFDVRRCEAKFEELLILSNDIDDFQSSIITGILLKYVTFFAYNIVIAGKPDIEFIVLLTDSSVITLMNIFVKGAKILSKSLFFFRKTNTELSFVIFEANFGLCIDGSKGFFKFFNLTFINNFVSFPTNPSDIRIDNNIDNNTVEINGLCSIRNEDGLSIVLLGSRRIALVTLYIVGSGEKYIIQEGVVVKDTPFTSLKDSVFFSLSSKNSGSGFKNLNSEGENVTLIVIAVQFEYCSSLKGGGALYLSNINNIIIDRSIFRHNIAFLNESLTDDYSGVGGCGLISCNRTQCSINITDSYFSENYAEYHSPLFAINTSNFIKNISITNNRYMDDAQSSYFRIFPLDVKIYLIDKFVLDSNFEGRSVRGISLNEFESSLNSNYILIESGSAVNLTLEVRDMLEQKMEFLRNSMAEVEILDSITKFSVYNQLGFSEEGSIYLTNLTLKGMPGSSIKARLSITISKYVAFNSEPLLRQKELYFKLKKCVKGEIITSELTCKKCPIGTFSFIDPMMINHSGATQKCSICPFEAVCPGGWLILPMPGFWRAHNMTLNILPCLVPSACIGPTAEPVTDSLENQLGRCLKGHLGNQCYSCEQNHGRISSTSICEECESRKSSNILWFIGTCIVLLIYSVGGSFFYSMESDSENSESGISLFVTVKITISFVQVVNLLTSSRFDWVHGKYKDAYSACNTLISFSLENILLNDCFIEVNTGTLGQFKLKMGLYVLLPIFLATFSSLVFFLVYQFNLLKNRISKKGNKHNRKLLLMRSFAGLVMSIFIFHPLILKNCFHLLNCTNFDPEKPSLTYLTSNPSIECWDPEYFKIILFAFIPGIVLWGLGFPILLIVVLRAQRDLKEILKLKKLSVKNDLSKAKNMETYKKVKVQSLAFQHKLSSTSQTFKKKKGSIHLLLKSNVFVFLHDGFKDAFSYWEGIIFLKKFFISMLINVSSLIGLEVVNLLLFIVLFLSLMLHLKYKPLQLWEHNFHETLSQLSCILVYSCVVALSSGLPGSFLPDFLAFLILLSFFSVMTSTLVLMIRLLIREKILKRICGFVILFLRRRSKVTKYLRKSLS